MRNCFYFFFLLFFLIPLRIFSNVEPYKENFSINFSQIIGSSPNDVEIYFKNNNFSNADSLSLGCYACIFLGCDLPALIFIIPALGDEDKELTKSYIMGYIAYTAGFLLGMYLAYIYKMPNGY